MLRLFEILGAGDFKDARGSRKTPSCSGQDNSSSTFGCGISSCSPSFLSSGSNGHCQNQPKSEAVHVSHLHMTHQARLGADTPADRRSPLVSVQFQTTYAVSSKSAGEYKMSFSPAAELRDRRNKSSNSRTSGPPTTVYPAGSSGVTVLVVIVTTCAS